MSHVIFVTGILLSKKMFSNSFCLSSSVKPGPGSNFMALLTATALTASYKVSISISCKQSPETGPKFLIRLTQKSGPDFRSD